MRMTAAILFAASAAHAAITGTLIGVDGKPVAGATVQAFPAETSEARRARLVSSSPERTAIASTRSGENGAFSIDPKSLLADVVVSIGGRTAALIEIPDGEDAGVIVVSPQPWHHLRVTADGKPAANALVAVGPLTLRTNAEGELDLPESNVERPEIIQSGFAPAEEPSLTKGVTLSGKVTGPAVDRATVFVDGWPLGKTDASGQFSIAHAPKNWRMVTVVRDTRIGEAPNKPGRAIAIALVPSVQISGVVRDASGKGLPGARVMLRRPGGFAGMPESVITDAKGAFAFPPVAPGEYDLMATHFAYSGTDVSVSAAKSVSKSIEARPFAVVRGRVVDENRAPVAGAVVTFGARPLSYGGAALTNASGEFTLRANLTPNFPQPIVAVHNGYAAGTSAAMTSDPGKTPVTVTMRRGFPLLVNVVDKQRQAVPDATLFVSMTSPDLMFRSPVVCEPALSSACHETDANGSANFRTVEGTYTIIVRGDAIAVKNIPPQPLTARSSPLTIQVDRGVAVAGRVLYRDGTPVPDVTVMPKISFMTMARTNPDGTFELQGVPPGPTSLIVRLANSPAPAATADVTAPDANVTLTLPTPAHIEGRVTDKATGEPITDFAILATQRDARYFGPGSRPKQVHSDAGTFTIDDAPLGAVTVRVTAPGYAVQTNDITLEEGKTISDLAFPLEHGGRIVGRITADDQPVSGASIRLGSDPATTTSDADGQYVIDSVTPGERIVDVQKQGFIAQHKTIEVAANKDAKLDIVLSRGKEMVGRVVDANGQAVINARLFLRNAGRAVSGYGPGVFTDGDGQFKFEGLADGHYTIQASKDGFVNGTADGDVPSTTPVTITLKSGGTITGRVAGLSDADLASASVFATAPDAYARAQVDAGGTFTLRGVPDGKVTVSANVGGMSPRRTAPKIVEVVNGTAPPIQLDFSEGVTVSGHITQNGVPIGAGSISFAPKKGTDGGSGAPIAGDGSYSVTGLTAGDFTVRVFSYAGARYETDYTVNGNATFDIDMKGATLHGRVVDAATNEPLSDANVYAQKETKYVGSTTSGVDGRFVLSAVPDGTITMHASREEYAAATQSVVVASGAAADVELRLDRGQEAVIQILDAPSGNPISGFIGILSGNKVINNGSPGDDGKMHVWLPAGTYKANVSAPDYVPTRVDLTVPGPEVRVPLSRAGKLIIVSKSGGDVQMMLAGLPLDSAGKRMVRAVAGAPTYVGGLAPGHYEVDVMNSDRATVKQSYSVDVIAGQTSQLNID